MCYYDDIIGFYKIVTVLQYVERVVLCIETAECMPDDLDLALFNYKK